MGAFTCDAVDSLNFSRVGLTQSLYRAKRALEKDGKRHVDTTENMFGTSLMEKVKSAAAMFLPTPKFSRVELAQILNRAKRALEKDGKRHADTTENMFGTSLMEEVKSTAAMLLPTPVVRACFVLLCMCACMYPCFVLFRIVWLVCDLLSRMGVYSVIGWKFGPHRSGALCR